MESQVDTGEALQKHVLESRHESEGNLTKSEWSEAAYILA